MYSKRKIRPARLSAAALTTKGCGRESSRLKEVITKPQPNGTDRAVMRDTFGNLIAEIIAKINSTLPDSESKNRGSASQPSNSLEPIRNTPIKLSNNQGMLDGMTSVQTISFCKKSVLN